MADEERQTAETLPGDGADRPVEEAPDPLVGRVLEGRYRLDERLGEGGVGMVYRGVHLRIDRKVAVKVLHKEYGKNPVLRLRFEREARAMAALSHPNIVSLADYGVDDDLPYLVMELLEGRTLGDVLDDGPLDPPRAFDVMRQILRALSYAHGRGLAHRDLKPDNVFLQALPDDEDHVRLLDFGLAKFVVADDRRDGPPVTVAGMTFGTPAYMAPEQAAGQPSDTRSDVYAAGVLLFEMLSGRRPFEGEPMDMLRRHLLEAPPTLSSVRPGCPPDPSLDRFVAVALEKEPGRRFQDAADMLEAFVALKVPAGSPGQAPKDPTGRSLAPRRGAALAAPEGPAPSRLGPRARVLLAAIGAASLLAVLAAGGGIGACIALAGRGEDVPTAAVALVPPPTPPPAAVAWGAPPAPVPASPGPVVPHAAAARPPARNPWRDGRPTSGALERARQSVEARGRASEGTVRTLRGLAASDPTDPRPFILLGRIYNERGWRSDALDQYERALSRDPGCRGDPAMLSDIVGLVGHQTVGDRAADLVRRVYGPEAIPVVDAASAAPGLGPAELRRYQTLRRSLGR